MSKLAPKGVRPLEKMTEVLVHWKDGLYYLGSITKIDRAQETCSVVFEDSSVDVIKMKDVYPRAPEDSEISCDVCNQEGSEEPNEIVLCDNCHYGYHQNCHVPPIDGDALLPGVPWHCRRCIFNAGVHAGGAVKDGLLADMMKVVKHHLPYEMESLQWDTAHRVNEDDTYCYCGGPGEWFKRMLQCCRCLQWFHEACLQCLDSPVLYGDRSYIFVCLVCNGRQETLERLPISREDMVQLALFNMNMADSSKNYFETTEDISKWLKKHWLSLTSSRGNPLSQRSAFTEEEVKAILLDNPAKFVSGAEMRKSRNMFSLRVRAPPPRNTRCSAADSSAASAEWDRRWPREPSPEHVIGRKRKRRSMMPPDSPPSVPATKTESDEPCTSAADDVALTPKPPGRMRGWSRRRGSGGRGFLRVSRGTRCATQPASERIIDENGTSADYKDNSVSDVPSLDETKSFPLPIASSTINSVQKRRGRPPGFGRGRFVVPHSLRRGRAARHLSARGKKYGRGRILSGIGVRSVTLPRYPSAGRPRIGLGRGRGRGGRGRGRGASQSRTNGSGTPTANTDFKGVEADTASTSIAAGPLAPGNESEILRMASPTADQSYSSYQENRNLPGSWEDDELFSSSNVGAAPLPSYFDASSTSVPTATVSPGQGDRRIGGRGSRRLLSSRGRAKPILPAIVRKPPALSLRRPRGRPRRGGRTSFSSLPRGAVSVSEQTALYGSTGDCDDGSSEPPKKKLLVEDKVSTAIAVIDGKGDVKSECFCTSVIDMVASSSDRAAPLPSPSAADQLFRESPDELRLSVQNALGAPHVVVSGSGLYHVTARRFVDGRSSPEYLVEHESTLARHIGIPM